MAHMGSLCVKPRGIMVLYLQQSYIAVLQIGEVKGVANVATQSLTVQYCLPLFQVNLILAVTVPEGWRPETIFTLLQWLTLACSIR
jgi:hypothetical protein